MGSGFKFDTTRSRSELMKKIRSQDTEPEKILRKELWRLGYRYRLNSSQLPGKPDIVFNKHKLVIFVDGEFWHGYNWKQKKTKIKANRKYWIKKIEGNIRRDIVINNSLQDLGYSVLRFWGFQIKNELTNCLEQIIFNLNSHKLNNLIKKK